MEANKENSRTPLNRDQPPHTAQMQLDPGGSGGAGAGSSGGATGLPHPGDHERDPLMMNGSARIPTINITTDSMQGSMGSIPRSSRSRSPSPGPGTSRSNGVHYRGQGHSADTSLEESEPQFGSTSRHGYPGQPHPSHVTPPGGDEYLDRTIPPGHVTVNPLGEGEDPGADIKTPGGTLKRQVKFDWESIDPELLQHCRTTNPVLHENKYWV